MRISISFSKNMSDVIASIISQNYHDIVIDNTQGMSEGAPISQTTKKTMVDDDKLCMHVGRKV